MAGLEALIAGRPVAAHALDEAQRGVNLLLDGKKALKGRRLLPLRKGDVVTGCGEGGEGGAGGGSGERGVVEVDHGDGSFTVLPPPPPPPPPEFYTNSPASFFMS